MDYISIRINHMLDQDLKVLDGSAEPYQLPGTEELRETAVKWLGIRNAVLLSGHGAPMSVARQSFDLSSLPVARCSS